MYCLLRHVLHRSVAFISIISQGHFPLFSPWSSIFHLRAASSMHWGLGFDFKIHWKQLAPSLPSPVLSCSPSSSLPTHTPMLPEPVLRSDPSGAFELAALSPLLSSGAQSLPFLRSQRDNKLPLITMRGKRLKRHKEKSDEFNDRIRDRRHCDYRVKILTLAGDGTAVRRPSP